MPEKYKYQDVADLEEKKDLGEHRGDFVFICLINSTVLYHNQPLNRNSQLYHHVVLRERTLPISLLYPNLTFKIMITEKTHLC